MFLIDGNSLGKPSLSRGDAIKYIDKSMSDASVSTSTIDDGVLGRRFSCFLTMPSVIDRQIQLAGKHGKPWGNINHGDRLKRASDLSIYGIGL